MPVFLDRARRATAPVLARLLRRMIQSSLTSRALKTGLWSLADYYVSFYGAKATVPTRFGADVAVDTSKMVEKQIFYFGEWEPYLTRHLLDMHRPDGTFLDIGSNIGYFSLLAAQRFDHVIAIEASPSIANRLADNAHRNGAGNIDIRNVAAGEIAGEAEFFFDDDQSGGSSLLPGSGRRLEAVLPVRPLDQIVTPEEIARVSFIKLDVEGFEHIVLRQILNRIEEFPEALSLTVEYDPERGQDLWPLCAAFLPHGFEIKLLQGVYDLGEYTDLNARSPLTPLSEDPQVFCDLLIRRM